MYLVGVGAEQLQIKPKADAEVLSPRVVTFTSGASNGTKVTSLPDGLRLIEMFKVSGILGRSFVKL